ncbi:hypothetical protein D3C72_2325860 [compost metagenome]
MNEILKTETAIGKGVLTRDLSPYLIIVQSVFNTNPERVKKYLQSTKTWNKQKILITNEMTIPELGEYNSNKVVFI